jgi:hypothetical protein
MTVLELDGESDSTMAPPQITSIPAQRTELPQSPGQNNLPSSSATPDTGSDDADNSESFAEYEIDLASVSGRDPYDKVSRSATTVSAVRHRWGDTSKTKQSDDSQHEIPLSSIDPIIELDYAGNYLKGNSVHSQKPQSVRSLERQGNQDESSSSDTSDAEISTRTDNMIWKFRLLCGRIVNHEYVQIGIIILIVVNALMMGLATFDFVAGDPSMEQLFSSIDLGFLVIFSIECGAQLIYLGLSLFADGWLVFDLFIVLFSWSFQSMQIVRAFRIFRAFRLVTRVKPLRDLVLAIGAVMPRMYAIAALLLLIFYIYSVLFTELFSALPLSDNFFSRLDTSLFTCMQMMTLEWGDVAREVMIHEPWAWAPFTSFIAITGFIVFNLIVAVVCDAVALTEKQVRELDGFESDNPEHKLHQAMERVDLLQLHINDMLRTQAQVQELIEMMASELLNVEAERMKAEHREAELRIEIDRRKEYQERMQSPEQIETLERGYLQEKERRQQERKTKALHRQESLELEELKEKSKRTLGLPTLDNSKHRRRTTLDNNSTHRRRTMLDNNSTHRRRGSAIGSQVGSSGWWGNSSVKSLGTAEDANDIAAPSPKGHGKKSARSSLMRGDSTGKL